MEPDAAPVAEVPSVSPSLQATVLYAGPVRTAVSPTAVQAKSTTRVHPETTSLSKSIVEAHLSNETHLERAYLEQLPIPALIDKILALHSENQALRVL